MSKVDTRVPRYNELMNPLFAALKTLGGSGSNNEILNQVIKDLAIPDEVVDILHGDRQNMTELSYQLNWAKTYLKKYGILTNNERGVWAIKTECMSLETLDEKMIVTDVVQKTRKQRQVEKEKLATEFDPITVGIPFTDDTPLTDDDPANDGVDTPDEMKPWREMLAYILQHMDPYGFERLAQRILRECSFSDVQVTQKSGDGGIDGYGKLSINGIFSLNVAFQCKRYKGSVGAGEIRDFRGSLPTNIEKGVMITTGTFSKAARDEACSPGKQQIDLIDGEALIDIIAKYQIGVKPVITYEIDEEFFAQI